MTRKPRIAVILGSTRDSRFGTKPADWILDKARARGDWEVELVDLKDYDLPLFNEMASNAWMPSADPRAVAWQEKIASFDGYIFVVAEYNRSITGALKNALDQAYVDWNRKAFGVVGYGALGASRAIEHLRSIGIELQMVSTRSGVHIAGADFFEAVVFFEAIAGLFFEDVAALFFAAAGLCFGATPFFDATAEPFFELLLVGWLAASFRRLFFLATDPEAFPGDFLDDFFVAMDAFPEGHPQNK